MCGAPFAWFAQGKKPLLHLEGDVFVGDFWAGGGAELFRGGGAVIEVFATAASSRAATGAGACGHAVAAATEHAEIGGDNFETGALLAFLILPFAGLDAAFNEYLGAFFQILLGDFGLFAPNDDFVPLGALLAFAVAVFEGFVGGDGKIGDGLAAAGVAGFRVAAETADEDDFIYGHEWNSPAEWKITWGCGKGKCVGGARSASLVRWALRSQRSKNENQSF
jgi:hypothetical protein